MAITFPSSPNVGDTFTSGGRSWQYNGTAWVGYGNLPDPSVFAVDATNDTVTVTGDISVSGDFTVSGTTTTINTTDLNVQDNVITLNYGVTGTPSLDAGIEVERGDSANTSITWDESAESWVVGGTAYVDTANLRVGILNGPVAKLDVPLNIGDASLLIRGGDLPAGQGGQEQIVFSYANTLSYPHSIRTRHSYNSQAGNAIDFYTWNYGVDSSTTYGTKHVMTLDGTGRVGIGTTSPSEALDVVGNVNVSGEVSVANDLTVDSYVLHVDSTNNRVGMGTTYPQRQLHVFDTLSGATGYGLTGGIDIESIDITGINILSPNAGYGRIYFGSPVSNTAGAVEYIHNATVTDGYMKFRAGAADRMHILGNGNVGIGTTTPISPLHINGSGNLLSLQSNGTSDRSSIKLLTNGSDWEIGARGSAATPGNSFYIYDNDSSAYRMVIDTSGNVGIGETNPLGKLHIKTADVSGFTPNTQYDHLIVENGTSAKGTVLQLVGPTNGVCEVGFSDSTRNAGLISFDHAANNMNFNIGNTNYVTFNSSGISAYNYKYLGLNVSYESGNRNQKVPNGIAVWSGFSGGSNRPTTYDIALSVNAAGMGMEFSADWLSTTGAGPLYFRTLRDCCQNWSSWSTISISVSSDRRMKTNITDIANPRSIVEQLNAIEYDALNPDGTLGDVDGEDVFDNNARKPRPREHGFIAQDLMQVLPFMVKHNENFDTPNEYGWASAYTVDYERLVPVLTETTKELYALVDQQAEIISTLTARIEALEAN